MLPAALHRALAASSNEEISIVWDTSSAMLVTIADLTCVAKCINATRHITFKAQITAELLSLVLTMAMMDLFRGAANQWLTSRLPCRRRFASARGRQVRGL